MDPKWLVEPQMASGFLSTITSDDGLTNNLELLQQMGLLRQLVSNEATSHSLYSLVTAARVGNELYQRVSGKRTVDDFKKQCYANIAMSLKKKPNASEKEVQEIVQSEIALFAMKVSAM